MLLIMPLTRIGPLKNKITPINLACFYIAAMTTSFYLGTNFWTYHGRIFVSDRINFPEELSLEIIPTWMAPEPNIAKQLLTGGVPIPWDAWAAPILFFWFFDVTIAVFMLSMANIFRRQWIDVEKVPFPHAIAINELMNLNTQMAGTTPKVSGRVRPFLLGMAIGLVYQGTVMLAAYFPWFPDIFAWREFTCANGGWQVINAIPGLKPIAGLANMSKQITVIAIAYLVPLTVLFNVWFWFFAYLVVTQILYSMGYYTGITDIGPCGKCWCHPSVLHDPPLALSMVSNGGIIAFTVIHLFLTRGYLMDTLRAAMGKGKLAEIEKEEPMSYRTSYILLAVSLVILCAVLLVLGAGGTFFFVPMAVFIMFIFNSRLWGMTGVWAKGTSNDFGSIFGKFTFWQGAAPNPPTREWVFSNMFQVMQDDPNWGWYGTACASFASYRVASLTGLSNRGVTKVFLGAMVVAPLFAMISMISVLYAFGSGKIAIGSWLPFQGLINDYLISGGWAGLPGPEQSPQLVAGFVIVGLFTYLHARFVWFPFEPMGFILGTAYASLLAGYWFTFLVAWVAKTITLRIGGSKLYEGTGIPIAGGIIGGAMIAVLFGGLIGIYKFFLPF
jgi:hypothetical protein